MGKHEYISKLVSTNELKLEAKLEGMEIHVISKAEDKGMYLVRDLYKPKSKKFIANGENLREFNRLVLSEVIAQMRADHKNIKKEDE